MRRRLVGLGAGIAFGFILSWGSMADPDAIRAMLVLDDAYLWLMFCTAVATGFVGIRVARRLLRRAVVTGEPIAWQTSRPERRHVAGGALFGLGWAISTACPGPVAAQIGQGVLWSVFPLIGIVAGVLLYLRRQERTAPTPTREGAASKAAVPATAGLQ